MQFPVLCCCTEKLFKMTVSSYRYGVPAHSFKIEFPRLNVVVFFFISHQRATANVLVFKPHCLWRVPFNTHCHVVLHFLAHFPSTAVTFRHVPSVPVSFHTAKTFLWRWRHVYCPQFNQKEWPPWCGRCLWPPLCFQFHHREQTQWLHRNVCLKIMKLNLPPSPLQA